MIMNHTPLNWVSSRQSGLLGLVLLSAILCLTGLSPSALALQPTVNILVAAEPQRDLRRAQGPLSELVTEVLYEALEEEDFAAHDIDHLTDLGYLGSTSRYGLIESARLHNRPPMDLMVLHSSRVELTRSPQGPVADILISAELIEVSSGRRLETFRQLHPRSVRLPRHCDRRCMFVELKDDVHRELQGLSYRVIDTLHDHIPAQDTWATAETRRHKEVPGLCGMERGWELSFSNFDAAMMDAVEEYLVAFSCYGAHRPTDTRTGRYVYWYESGIAPAHLQRNLHRMAEDLGIEMSITGQGTRYSIAFGGDTLFDDDAAAYDGW